VSQEQIAQSSRHDARAVRFILRHAIAHRHLPAGPLDYVYWREGTDGKRRARKTRCSSTRASSAAWSDVISPRRGDDSVTRVASPARRRNGRTLSCRDSRPRARAVRRVRPAAAMHGAVRSLRCRGLRVLRCADFDFTRPEARSPSKHARSMVIAPRLSSSKRMRSPKRTKRIPIAWRRIRSGRERRLQAREPAPGSSARTTTSESSKRHHRHKVDAPPVLRSRSAKSVAQAPSASGCGEPRRHAKPGDVRRSRSVPRHRGGVIVASHTVLFAGVGERVEIVGARKARTYAVAPCAPQMAARQAPGLYIYSTCWACR